MGHQPQTPFVAGFVGANNRIIGRAESIEADLVQVVTSQGWRIRARRQGAIGAGDAVEAFVRPEACLLGRGAAELPAELPLACRPGAEPAVRRCELRRAARGGADAS
ncbi:MAG: hypothetical protein U1F35_13870 [Steroidobacteraceae bacterium]